MELTKRDYDLPDSKGHFAEFGGRFVPETLIPALDSLEEHYLAAKENKLFNNELSQLLKYYCGRETPLYKADEISKELGFNLWL